MTAMRRKLAEYPTMRRLAENVGVSYALANLWKRRGEIKMTMDARRYIMICKELGLDPVSACLEEGAVQYD